MNLKRPILLITGAAGMIGSCAVRYLNDLGNDQLILVDDLKKSEKWKNLVGKSFLDLVPKSKLFDLLEERGSEIGGVLHLGACSDTTEQDADYLMENNVRFTIRLATWALSENKRFVYASSAATYGDGKEGFFDEEKDLYRLKPLNMYGYSKHLVDLWMQRTGGFKRAVALKYFNIFGPNEYHKGKMRSMVLKMAQIAKEEGSISLFQSNDPKGFADGEQARDFLYVKDAVKMTLSFFEQKNLPVAGIFNIGQGKATTWNSLANSLFKALEISPNISYVEMPKELMKQYQNYTCAEMTKFFRHFPDFDFTPIPTAVFEYVRDYILKDGRW